MESEAALCGRGFLHARPLATDPNGRFRTAEFSRNTDKTAKSLEDGWRWLVTDGLKSYVEKTRDGSEP